MSYSIWHETLNFLFSLRTHKLYSFRKERMQYVQQQKRGPFRYSDLKSLVKKTDKTNNQTKELYCVIHKNRFNQRDFRSIVSVSALHPDKIKLTFDSVSEKGLLPVKTSI